MKHMKLNFYILTTTPKYVGGERAIHFKYVDQRTQVKKIMKKRYKKRTEYLIKRPLLQTLTGYMEARKCKTLDQFQNLEWKEELWNAIEHEGGQYA